MWGKVEKSPTPFYIAADTRLFLALFHFPHISNFSCFSILFGVIVAERVVLQIKNEEQICSQ